MTDPCPIVARDLRFTYAGRAVPAIRDVSFELGPGQVLLVVGPSGSGKSTVAKALAGLIPHEVPGAFDGELRIGDVDVATAARTDVAQLVGVVFQDPASQLVMDRVEDDVAFGLENRRWSRDAMRERVPEILAASGLAGYERRRPTRLSGGEQQRLALAGALAPRPGLLVLDEPTANLDPAATADVFAGLDELRAQRSRTIVLIEHRADRAWPLADRVLALGPDGAPLDVGAPGAVLTRSADAMAAAGIWLPGDDPGALLRAGSGGRTAEEPVAAGFGSPIVQASNLRFGYERGPRAEPVIRGVDLEFRPGERVALTGSNGSGKSTLARLLVGLLRPDRGWVRIGGREPSRLSPARLARLAGFVFQEPERQFLADRVDQEIALGLTPAERIAAIELMAALHLPLEEFAERSPYQLSGGEQRRLSLACALVRDPGFLVLDEPTFGQDRRGYEGLLAILHSRVSEGATVLAATHDERLVADFAARRIVLEDGWVIAHERVEKVAWVTDDAPPRPRRRRGPRARGTAAAELPGEEPRPDEEPLTDEAAS